MTGWSDAPDVAASLPAVASHDTRAAQPFTRAWLGGPRVDLLIACALWAAGFCVAASYMTAFNRRGGVADFLQPEFGAAVALACGSGFVNLGYTATPGLARFLARDRDTFSCDELTGVSGGELNITQRLYRYLMSTVALVWAVRGVSWSGLWPLFALLFACVMASAYGLFRLAAGQLLAVATSLALLVSAIHLGHLPYLRDYAKAPFMLALFLVMGRIAIGPVTIRRMVAYGAAFGLILGIGFGFRNDLLINVPPFFAVVLLCLPGKLSQNLRCKAAAIAAAAATFVVTAWPILRGYGIGSNTGHVALLGLMTPFDKSLGIRSAYYDWGYAYVDQFGANIVNSYSHAVHGRFVAFLSQEYDHAAVAYLLQIVRHWPADIVARGYASVLNILEMPFTVGTYAYSIPYAATSDRMTAFYGWQTSLLLRYLAGRGVVLTVLALAIISSRSVWTAAALLLLLLYYAGYPAIQFDVRHFFHLEFIAWWALAFVLQQAVSFAWSRARGDIESFRTAARMWARPLARAVVFVITATTLITGSLTTLRAYQAPHVRALVRDYAAAPKERLETTRLPDGQNALIISRGLWELARDETASMPVRLRYLVAEFSASAACDVVQLPVNFRYWYRERPSDFSRQIVLKLMPSGGATRIFFPAYYNHSWSSSKGPSESHFDGIELPRRDSGCMTALYRITDRRRFPLLLDMTLAPAWEQAMPFQTLTTIEHSHRGGAPGFYTVPSDLVVTRSAFAEGAQSISNEVTDRASIATRSRNGAWVATGRADGPQSSLLRFRGRPVPRHSVLVAEGELRTGGVSFALLTGMHAGVKVSVTEPGPFVVALEAPADGEFGVAVANDIVPWWPASHIGRRVGPLVAWIPGATLRTDVVVNRIGWWIDGSRRE